MKETSNVTGTQKSPFFESPANIYNKLYVADNADLLLVSARIGAIEYINSKNPSLMQTLKKGE